MHDHNAHNDGNQQDAQRRRESGPATLSRAIDAQRGSRGSRGSRGGMAPPHVPTIPFGARTADRTPGSQAGPDLVVHEESAGSNTGAVIAACVAGAIGALVWYGVAAITGYEIGWIAWGVGALVGGAYHSQGGSPMIGMATCAGIAVLAILGGKYLAFNTTVGSELEELHESGQLSRMYIWLRQNADRYNSAADKVAASRELAAELWHDGARGARVDAEELAEFQADIAPLLVRVPRHETYEQFRAAESGHFEAVADFGDAFDFIDILFLLFGVMSAMKLANGEQA